MKILSISAMLERNFMWTWPTGDALVEFGSEDDASRAMSYDRQMIGDRYVELRRSSRPSLEDDRGDGIIGVVTATGGVTVVTVTVVTVNVNVGGVGVEVGAKRGNVHLDQRGGKRKQEFGPDGTALIAQSANPQLTLKARRVYVGNLPQLDPPISEPALKEFFDQAMHQVQDQGAYFKAEFAQAGLTQSPGCCVCDVWISSEKHFAFIEVRTVQEATSAMTLDGITFYGTPLRVNRPHDYVPPAPDAMIMTMAQAGLMGSGGGIAANLSALMQQTKKARRIHVGNLLVGSMTSASLKQFISQSMQQLSLVVKPGDPCIDSFLSGDGNFGFVEMRTVAEANNAMALSGIECNGRPIRVGRPADYVPLNAELIAQCQGTGILGTPGDAGVTEAVGAGMLNGPDESKATEVVVIRNMMSDDDLANDDECKDIAEDTISKCEEEYGKVVRFVIVRPGREGAPADLIGNVLVQFETKESAIKAANDLNHVKFDERVVETDYMDPARVEEVQKLYPEQSLQ
ncbi:hypothetical protein GUITHDRAFT_112506 [Guillardia theta CCMP2712]|uniref:RRM domain-containing protein n=1 Tax=Guillardia theta (strain CCMP2712) TaxID=905079 RepID=L1IZL5_GUITC|nr:hypothetical protein GUITHDRAFT_112506 [Guillardia theta CCMP2712]EKX41532.1 hypothetical protein GUITHDRAFT_112506 [Guillardia theta CCMP2712]|eukprot:XP_005828512.1 hypothetical protein GUITHDRAFT_112506 [Guillardia theta CCMP2712]